MATALRSVGFEVLQFVPIISFAFPFIVSGGVDLTAASTQFASAAIVAIIIKCITWRAHAPFNPILIGVDLWLVIGAFAFNLPIDWLRTAFAEQQAVTLFVVIGLVGIVMTVRSPTGFLGQPTRDSNAGRNASWVLVGLSILSILWAYGFRTDIRIGGALPFIALNMARRLMMRRLAKNRSPSPTC